MINRIRQMLQGNLLTLQETIQEGSGTVSFRFHYDKGLTWKAGQHGIFRIEHPKIKKAIRPFSISSSPTEGFIQITTNLNSNPLSDFKSALRKMKTGDTIRMLGLAGSMVMGKKEKLVLIAGGLGITPFRAILKQFQANPLETDEIDLIYIDSSHKFLFLPDSQDPRIKIQKATAQDEFYSQVNEVAIEHGNKADYLISGSPQFVKSVTNALNKAAISSSSIKKDPFYGSK